MSWRARAHKAIAVRARVNCEVFVQNSDSVLRVGAVKAAVDEVRVQEFVYLKKALVDLGIVHYEFRPKGAVEIKSVQK